MINTKDMSRAHINKIFVCENHLITYSLRKLIVMRNFNNILINLNRTSLLK